MAVESITTPLPQAMVRMRENFGHRLRIASVLELKEEGAVFVEDGNHGENRPRQNEFADVGIAFIKPPDLKNGRVDFENCARINESGFKRVRKGIATRGDIILTHRATVGRIAITNDDAPEVFVTNPGTTVYRSTNPDILDQRYLYCFMRSPAFMQQLWREVGNNSTFDYVSLTQQRSLRIGIPPITEQRAIASILGALDDKIELNRRMNELLEGMARAIFKAWFIDFEPVKAKAAGAASFPGMPQHVFDALPNSFANSELGEIPKGWDTGTLRDVVDVHDRKRVPLSKKQRDQKRGKVPYYEATGIIDYVDDHLFDGVHVLLGEDGSVARDDGTPFVQYVWGQYWVNNHAHVLSGANDVGNEYIYLLLCQTDIRPFVTGAVQAKLNQGNMNAIPSTIAPQVITSAFRKVVEPLFALYRSLSDETLLLASIRDTLLPKLISGEISVPSTNGGSDGG